MPENNADRIRGLYEAFSRGDVPTVLASMAPDIHWEEAENFLYDVGKPFVGPQAVLNGVFMRLATEWDGFAVNPTEFLDAGDNVVVLGTYTGTYKATGKPVRAQFGHVWTLRDGSVTPFRQLTDTRQFAAVAGV
jgi:ketosteroid isomerase-like protein